jgi:hypothetical protein
MFSVGIRAKVADVKRPLRHAIIIAIAMFVLSACGSHQWDPDVNDPANRNAFACQQYVNSYGQRADVNYDDCMKWIQARRGN